MNNKNGKKYLKFEYPKKYYSLFQNIKINNSKKINIIIIKIFFLIISFIILIFFFYFQNLKTFKKNKIRYDIYFDYASYENNII